MKKTSKTGKKTTAEAGARLRELPSVDELMARPTVAALAAEHGRAIVLRSARQALAGLRREIADGAELGVGDIEARVRGTVAAALEPSLRRVINATGVVLHTNLGRAPLSNEAASAIGATSTRYTNLEYDVAAGKRGRRDVHTSAALAELAGAESAIVVNNNAAAIFLVLHALAKGGEVIVSRGELIEIGDGFRIPDIMAESGAVLREVGTTNRTHVRDYENAVNDRTKLILRVHPSNFQISGFTGRPSLEELAAVGEKLRVPVYEDLGSGCLADLSGTGLSEPVVRSSCSAGVAVATYSCDKLLGGPQAGIIAGKKDVVEKIRRDPMFRVLRVDKLTIAALEATARAYLRGAIDEIPALRMIRATAEAMRLRSEIFCAGAIEALPRGVRLSVVPGFSVVGGGSTPDQQIASHVIAVEGGALSVNELEARLRSAAIPVIARIEDGKLILDLRTVRADEESELLGALVNATRN
ncbi:MAG: L-seryl-tRNA(Sec) selenium transferase [Candidatus Acidiferrales bacterium]|jgi:L-seryl-tRNA(Ser) seleniumtransferase